MAKHIAILGAGGYAREVYLQVKRVHKTSKLVFVDDVTDREQVRVDGQYVPVVKDWKFDSVRWNLQSDETVEFDEFIIGVGDPRTKLAMVQKAVENNLDPIEPLIDSDAIIGDADCEIGKSTIVSAGCKVTTNVKIGDYVILNGNITVGHDAVIGNFVSCNPGCAISGGVTLGQGVVLGAGTVVREGVTVADGVYAGAQSCIVKDIEEPGAVIVGVPARKLDRS